MLLIRVLAIFAVYRLLRTGSKPESLEIVLAFILLTLLLLVWVAKRIIRGLAKSESYEAAGDPWSLSIYFADHPFQKFVMDSSIYLYLALFILSAVAIGMSWTNTKEQGFPSEFVDDRANFEQVKILFYEANELTRLPEGVTIAPSSPEVDEKIHSLKKRGIALSEEVDDAFLDYLHPDLKNLYRNKKIRGEELWLEGFLESTSWAKQIEGIRLTKEYSDWWNSHNESIIAKAFPD